MSEGGMMIEPDEPPKIVEDQDFSGKPMWNIDVNASTATSKNYDEGGVVPPDGQVDLSQLPGALPPPPAFNPNAGMPPPPPLPGMPPSVTPDDFKQFQAQQQAGLNKYGPEQQIAVQNDIINRQNSLPSRLGQAGAGFADALMAVGGKQSPGFMKAMQDKQAAQGVAQMGTMEKAQTGQMTKMQAEMKLAEQDPASPISRMAQKAYGSTLKNMPGGESLTDAQIALIPASTMADISSKKIDLTKALAEIENTQAFREASIGMQRASLANTARHERTEEGISQGAKQQEAAKTLAGRGIMSTLANMIPGTAGHAATGILEQQAAGQPPAFQSEADAESAGLPVGTIVTIGGRRARVK